MIYKDVENFIVQAQSNLKVINSGTLRFFGDWFGRPMDNYHVVNQIEYNANQIVMQFDDGHILKIDNPIGIVREEQCFKIEKATKVRYEYGHYGPKHGELKYYLEYINENDEITKHSGLIEGGLRRTAKINKGHNAFEIYGR
ncbi:MAG: hypothetical protein JXR48_17755 [Candidatus Delongbacteria bacterium]|nr:hypothetical protein [Candidatus Delongbacteria bacterium]MBN2836804.1 hypothetical protein [Candidatus Delongbacteria bacterium]